MPELLERLANHPLVTPVTLETNYRCGAQIIAMAQAFKESTAVVTGDRAGGTVDTRYCPNGFAEQCTGAAQWIADARDRYPLHEIGVLCPVNEQCEQVADTLRQAGVPALYRSKDEYRPTRVTLFVEACAAWCCFGKETSHYRLADLLRTWRYTAGRPVDCAGRRDAHRRIARTVTRGGDGVCPRLRRGSQRRRDASGAGSSGVGD